MEDEKSLDEVAYEAIEAARRKFNDTILDYLYDPAYFDVKITVWIKDCTLTHRLKRIEVEDQLVCTSEG